MKLSNLFRRKPSREVAKDRLKILLISDRVNCSPEILEMIKKDIAEVISRQGYFQVHENRHKQYGNPDQQSVDAGQGGEDPFDLRQHPDSGSP